MDVVGIVQAIGWVFTAFNGLVELTHPPAVIPPAQVATLGHPAGAPGGEEGASGDTADGTRLDLPD